MDTPTLAGQTPPAHHTLPIPEPCAQSRNRLAAVFGAADTEAGHG